MYQIMDLFVIYLSKPTDAAILILSKNFTLSLKNKAFWRLLSGKFNEKTLRFNHIVFFF